jgi:UrcA family protein
MNTKSNLPLRSSLACVVRKVAVIALCAIAPFAAMADQQPAMTSVTRTTHVSFADIELSTPAGQRAARERLHQIARRLCAEVAGPQDISHQSNFVACVDETLANALRQLNGPTFAATEKSPR